MSVSIPIRISTFSYVFIFCVLFLSSCKTDLVPQGRFGHTANLIGQKLYFLGGLDSQNHPLSDFFYLDLQAQDFANSNITFTNVTNQTNPSVSFGSSCVINQTRILLIGGMELNNTNNALALLGNEYSFDTNNSSAWDKRNVTIDQGPSNRRSFRAPIDEKGTMYVYGGSNQTAIYPANGNADTTMYKHDTITKMWMPLQLFTNLSTAQLPSFEYSATFLDNTTIVYIGGRIVAGTFQDMNHIWCYNTTNNKWTLYNATGDFVSPRALHSAILASDGRNIIVYGGYGENGTLDNNQALAILDTSKWTWNNSSLKTNPTFTVYGHTATLYQNYMIIAFGAKKSTQGNNETIEKNYISVLNTTQYNWITPLENTPGPITQQNSVNSVSKTGVMVGCVIGILVALGIIGGAGIWYYQRRRRRLSMAFKISEGHGRMSRVITK